MTNPLNKEPKDQYEKRDLEYNIPVFMATYGITIEDIRLGDPESEEDQWVLKNRIPIKLGPTKGEIIGINQNENGVFQASILCTNHNHPNHHQVWNTIPLPLITPHWVNCYAFTKERYDQFAANLENTLKEISQNK